MSSLTASFAARFSSAATHLPAGSGLPQRAFFVQPPMRCHRSGRIVCSAVISSNYSLLSVEKIVNSGDFLYSVAVVLEITVVDMLLMLCFLGNVGTVFNI